MKPLESFLERPGRALARLIAVIAIANLLLIGAALISRPAPAQTPAAGLPRPALVELLGDGYAEVPVAFGLAEIGIDGEGLLLELQADVARQEAHVARGILREGPDVDAQEDAWC